MSIRSSKDWRKYKRVTLSGTQSCCHHRSYSSKVVLQHAASYRVSVCKQILVISRHVAMQLDGQHLPRQDAFQHTRWTACRGGTLFTIACMSSSFHLHAKGSSFIILSQSSSSSFLSQFNLRPPGCCGLLLALYGRRCSSLTAACPTTVVRVLFIDYLVVQVAAALVCPQFPTSPRVSFVEAVKVML